MSLVSPQNILERSWKELLERIHNQKGLYKIMEWPLREECTRISTIASHRDSTIMHMDMWQDLFARRFAGKKSGLNSFRENPSVWTHSLGKKQRSVAMTMKSDWPLKYRGFCPRQWSGWGAQLFAKRFENNSAQKKARTNLHCACLVLVFGSS